MMRINTFSRNLIVFRGQNYPFSTNKTRFPYLFISQSSPTTIFKEPKANPRAIQGQLKEIKEIKEKKDIKEIKEINELLFKILKFFNIVKSFKIIYLVLSSRTSILKFSHFLLPLSENVHINNISILWQQLNVSVY